MHAVVSVFTQISTLLETYLFFILGMKWPFIMKNWSKIDYSMLTYGFPACIKLRLKSIAVFFCAFALGKYQTENYFDYNI